MVVFCLQIQKMIDLTFFSFFLLTEQSANYGLQLERKFNAYLTIYLCFNLQIVSISGGR